MSRDSAISPFDQFVSRRGLLQAGSLGAFGLSLPEFLRAEALRALHAVGEQPTRTNQPLPGRAKSCILFFLEGGPAHQDLWDMKPRAPVEIRGEFKPIETTIPGEYVCEHLSLLSRQMHHLALVRSVHHKINDHNAGAYYALTGQTPLRGSKLIIGDEPENFPPFGSVLAKLFPLESLPEFVHLPDIMSNLGRDIPGQRAGMYGTAYDPLVAGDPSAEGYEIPGLSHPRGMTSERLSLRRSLLQQIDRSGLGHSAAIAGVDAHYEKAFTLLASSETRRAFDLSQEPASLRERYGLPDRTDRSVEARKFGGLPHLGQCMLLARRLIESGVRLVTVCTGRSIDQSWDTHRQHFPLLKKSILPYADRAFSALLEDMSDRGLLDETLVVAMGEFGRTPKIGQITSSAGADSGGRDHWPNCYTVMLAGAGIRGGMVYGESDRDAAYPKTNPVGPEDVAASIYHALGLSPEMRIRDALDRPHFLSHGRPIVELFS
jgi:hypothetical protein